MDQRELLCNIEILESLGWFIAEAVPNQEEEKRIYPFDAVLQCCKADGSSIEEVPVTNFLLSLYDEEDGSLEARLWFFAPKYSTSLDNLTTLIDESSLVLEWSIFREYYLDTWAYEASIIRLGFDDLAGETYENSTHSGTSDISASMALAEAYLRCVGVYDG